MRNINNFNIDRNLSPEKQNKALTDYINEFYNFDHFFKLIKYLESNFQIPNEIFEQDVKSFLIKNFKNSEGKFFPKFGLYSIVKSFFKNILIYFWILIFEKKIKEKKSFYEIILDDVSHRDEAFRFEDFLKLFKSYLIISRVDLNQDTNYILFDKYKYLNLENSLKGKKTKIFYFLFKLFYVSLINKCNFQDIIFSLIRTIIKYESLFSKSCSYYLLQERQFTTSSLKNFIFKKHGGFKSLLFQRNIAQLNGPGMYTYSDYFFSLGNKTHLQYLKCQSYFEKIYPVGSLFMNSVKFNKKKMSKIPNFDLLHIASNMNYFQNTHSKFLDDWIEQFNWLKFLNEKYPNINICIKGRRKDGLRQNKRFTNFLESSKIKFVDEHPEDLNNQNFKYDSSHSYDYASNSKIICTWQSTMGFEMMSLKKPTIFLDPYSRNTAHLPNENYYRNIKAVTYQEFENFVIKNLNQKIYKSNFNSDDYCLNSNNTLKKTYQILMDNIKKEKNT